MSTYQHILIATDGSELSGKGLEAGIDIARQTAAKVTVITVSEPVHNLELGLLLRDQQSMDSYNARRRRGAEMVLSGARDAAAAAGIACETLYVENSAPARAILEAAKTRSCDLIVMTSHGRQGLERFILGSQTSRVVQGAETSVLVVR